MVLVSSRAIALSFGEANTLPTEFRLFAKGLNETEKGSFLFDDAAAASVLAAYQAWGVDLAIDLEHQMLSPDAPADPTARDARGWAKLEVRNGELWAVDVRWTTDGAERLAQKRQRYVSPAFEVDPQTNRITKIINVAITAIPATHHTPALIAADARGCMDPKLVKEALDALIAGDTEKCAELLKGAIASAASGESAEPADAPPAPDAAASAAPPAEGDAAPKPDDEEKKAAVVATTRLLAATGAKDVVAALAAVDVFKASHIALEAERQKLAEDRAILESAERRALCVELIRLGAEVPATVWADDSASKLRPEWLEVRLDTLRSKVSAQKLARGGKNHSPPSGNGVEVDGGKTFKTSKGPITLSASELAECERAGAKPEVYAENKARRNARRGG